MYPFSSLGREVRPLHYKVRDHGRSHFSIIQGIGRLAQAFGNAPNTGCAWSAI